MNKFQALENFSESLDSGYSLLPFNFTRLDGDDYVLTNMVGEYLILARDDLQDFVKHRLAPSTEAYVCLKAKHFLLDLDSNAAIDLLALKARTKFERLANLTGLHVFVASLRCEHACPYCQVSRQSDDASRFDMSPATADKALALTFSSPSPTIKIEFQGGEPLLNFPLVQYVVERAKMLNALHGRDLQFVIATNLALVTDEILAFCKTHEILISTSLDGPADLHNKNRPRPGNDSHQRAVDGINMARSRLGRNRVSALMTTTKASLGRVREIIDEYVRLEFPGIFLRPLSPYGFAVKTKYYSAYNADEWLAFYFEGLEYIIQLNQNGIAFREFYASLILSKMLTPFGTGFVDLRSPAGIGIGAIVYNYDGDVYASDESRMLAEMGDKTFRLGNVHNNTWEEIITADVLLDALESSYTGSAPMCSECAFEPFCGADPVFHYRTQGDTVGNKPNSAFCKRNMAIFRYLVSRMREDAAVHSLFRGWIRI
ncbi:His-Xaa-Ser system radical SAM maturase HxsB [bacterium]|nr:MAG: His-Xaa-Ser system radical SAM maturase HxsB [bacterium]